MRKDRHNSPDGYCHECFHDVIYSGSVVDLYTLFTLASDFSN